ncbi:unnamed protein product [Choristocarpus tenellus]
MSTSSYFSRHTEPLVPSPQFGDRSNSASQPHGTGPLARRASARTISCAICLDNIEERGMLESCSHPFCLACIVSWSEVTNSCPLCKARFNRITRVNALGKRFRSRGTREIVEVPDKEQTIEHPSEDEDAAANLAGDINGAEGYYSQPGANWGSEFEDLDHYVLDDFVVPDEEVEWEEVAQMTTRRRRNRSTVSYRTRESRTDLLHVADTGRSTNQDNLLSRRERSASPAASVRQIPSQQGERARRAAGGLSHGGEIHSQGLDSSPDEEENEFDWQPTPRGINLPSQSISSWLPRRRQNQQGETDRPEEVEYIQGSGSEEEEEFEWDPTPAISSSNIHGVAGGQPCGGEIHSQCLDSSSDEEENEFNWQSTPRSINLSRQSVSSWLPGRGLNRRAEAGRSEDWRGVYNSGSEKEEEFNWEPKPSSPSVKIRRGPAPVSREQPIKQDRREGLGRKVQQARGKTEDSYSDDEFDSQLELPACTAWVGDDQNDENSFSRKRWRTRASPSVGCQERAAGVAHSPLAARFPRCRTGETDQRTTTQSPTIDNCVIRRTQEGDDGSIEAAPAVGIFDAFRFRPD